MQALLYCYIGFEVAHDQNAPKLDYMSQIGRLTPGLKRGMNLELEAFCKYAFDDITTLAQLDYFEKLVSLLFSHGCSGHQQLTSQHICIEKLANETPQNPYFQNLSGKVSFREHNMHV